MIAFTAFMLHHILETVACDIKTNRQWVDMVFFHVHVNAVLTVSSTQLEVSIRYGSYGRSYTCVASMAFAERAKTVSYLNWQETKKMELYDWSRGVLLVVSYGHLLTNSKMCKGQNFFITSVLVPC